MVDSLAVEDRASGVRAACRARGQRSAVQAGSAVYADRLAEGAEVRVMDDESEPSAHIGTGSPAFSVVNFHLEFRDSLAVMDSRFRGNDRYGGNDGRGESDVSHLNDVIPAEACPRESGGGNPSPDPRRHEPRNLSSMTLLVTPAQALRRSAPSTFMTPHRHTGAGPRRSAPAAPPTPPRPRRPPASRRLRRRRRRGPRGRRPAIAGGCCRGG